MPRLLLLNLTDIVPDPQQPRKDFEPKRLRELSDNIKARGVRIPIIVRPHGEQNGRPVYMIVDGERRLRASEWAGKETIPAILEESPDETPDDSVFFHQLCANLHRQDLNPVERAEFLKTRLDMLKDHGFSDPTTKLAEELGVSTSWVTKNTAVLKYEDDVRALAREGKIRDYQLLKIVSALGGKKRQEVIQAIHDGTFNVSSLKQRKPLKQRKRKNDKSDGSIPEFALLPGEWIVLIENCQFLSTLEAEDPNWRVNLETTLAKLRELIAQP